MKEKVSFVFPSGRPVSVTIDGDKLREWCIQRGVRPLKVNHIMYGKGQ